MFLESKIKEGALFYDLEDQRAYFKPALGAKNRKK
jgi:hypothetical protein